jgi:hypothetical protein
MKRWAPCLLLLLSFPCWADASAAFTDGKNLGNAVNPLNLGAISAGNIQDKLPAYGQSVAETGYFQGGHGDTVGPGAVKVSLCATATPDSDPIRRQECDAVNFLARNPDIRPQFTITSNDPMILSARTERNSAEAVFQSSGISGGMGSNSQCVTRTETTPAQSTTETCSSIRELTTEQCTMGRIINIDTDANFQCDQTINAYETLKCRRGNSVTVGFDQCTPGVWLGRAAYVDCSWCVDPYMAMNIFCGGDGRSYDVEPYRSYDGVNRYDYNWIGYPWNGSYGLFHVPVAPGQSVTDYYVSNLGFGCNLYVYYSVNCSATTCTPSMRNVSSGCNSSGGTGVGAPLNLPITKTVSNWTSDQCAALRLRSQ